MVLIVISDEMSVLVGRRPQDKAKDHKPKFWFINMLDTRLLSRNDESTVWRQDPVAIRIEPASANAFHACLTYFSLKTKTAYVAFCV